MINVNLGKFLSKLRKQILSSILFAIGRRYDDRTHARSLAVEN